MKIKTLHNNCNGGRFRYKR